MDPIYLRSDISREDSIKGEIKGVAYSGSVIKEHGFYQNLVIDVSTLSVAKKKTPFLRDHDPSKTAGHGSVTISDGQVLVDGNLSKKSSHGQEIIAMSEDGFDWELSLGLFGGKLEEIENTEINGQLIPHGWVLRNGLIREVSIVALGADMNTNAEVFSQQTKGTQMKLTAEQFVALACACGGDKDTTPEELQEKVEKMKLMTDEQKAKAEELAKEIESLKADVAAKQAEIDKKQAEIDSMKASDEESGREEEMKAAAKAKGLTFADEKIKEAAKTKESTALFLSLIEDMKGTPKPPGGREDVSGGAGPAKTPEEIRLAAKQLIKEGKAKDMIEAMTLVEVK